MQPINTVSLNPFAVINGRPVTIALISSAITEIEPSSVWAGRAVALAEATAPLLCWAGDKKESGLTSSDVTTLLQFDNLCAVSDSESVSGPVVSSASSIGLPKEVVSGIESYLGDCPGFRSDDFLAETSPARKMHSFDVMVLNGALARLERSGHAPETVHA